MEDQIECGEHRGGPFFGTLLAFCIGRKAKLKYSVTYLEVKIDTSSNFFCHVIEKAAPDQGPKDYCY